MAFISDELSNMITYPSAIIFYGSILCGFLFTIAMLYHSFKTKHYWWFALILLLGPIFPIWFYMGTLRKEFLHDKEPREAKMDGKPLEVMPKS